MENEVDGLIAMITHLSQGVPPRDKDLPRLSPLCKLVLKKAEDFCVVSVCRRPLVKQNLDSSNAEQLHGAEALRHIYSEIESKMEKDAAISMQDLQPLKQFSWLLDAEQRAQVQKWVAAVAKRYTSSGNNLCIADSTQASSSGSIDIVAASSLQPLQADTNVMPAGKPSGTSNKKQAAVAEKVVDKKAMMLKFFNRAKK